MFYKRNYKDSKWGIVDTDDGVCEYYSDSELSLPPFSELNIQDSIDSDLVSRLSYNMNKKLYYMCCRGEADEFFKAYALPMLDSKFSKTSYVKQVYKCFNYADIECFFILVLDVYVTETNTVYKAIYIVREDSFSRMVVLPKDSWRMSLYPIGSGYTYNLLFKRALDLNIGLDSNYLFMLFYTNTGIYLVRVSDLSYKKICDYKGIDLR